MLSDSLEDAVLRAADRDLLEDVVGGRLPRDEGQRGSGAEEGLHPEDGGVVIFWR